MGMAHRGRLNVLANILAQALPHDLPRVRGQHPARHGGRRRRRQVPPRLHARTTSPGRAGRCTSASPPTPATSRRWTRWSRAGCGPSSAGTGTSSTGRKVLPLLIHGDAAFAGQGLVAETLNLSQLEGYRTGGTVHLVVNNQIGFTTLPREARSIALPHRRRQDGRGPHLPRQRRRPRGRRLRGRTSRSASASAFSHDVVVDMLCYRRHGHNEGDEPAFTQPVLYQQDRARGPRSGRLYQRRLVDAGALTPADADRLADEFKQRLQEAFESVKVSCPLPLRREHAFTGAWADFDRPYSHEPGDHRRRPRDPGRGGAGPHHRARRVSASTRRSPAGSRPSCEAVRDRR